MSQNYVIERLKKGSFSESGIKNLSVCEYGTHQEKQNKKPAHGNITGYAGQDTIRNEDYSSSAS
jgi:hypothetical protein